MFTPNKHTEKVQSDKEHPGKKVGIALRNSPLNRKFTFEKKKMYIYIFPLL